MQQPDPSAREVFEEPQKVLLLSSIFVIANCGLVYELLSGTISSYLVGAAVLQFSLVVGVFMAAMGVGAYVARWVQRDLLDVFIRVELAVGLVGGFSAFALYFSFVHMAYYTVVLYAVCGIIGAMIGMEIPLVIRLLKDDFDLEFNVSAVLGLDYVGALTASLAFPLLLLPYLGQMETAFLTGLINALVALTCAVMLRARLRRPRRAWVSAAVVVVLLGAGAIASQRIVGWFESSLYDNQIIYAEHSDYQRIVLTRWRDDLRLYLDGNLQFSTVDEYRYHESLVDSVMGMPGNHERVLVLGGGDGMAVREILDYDDVEHIDLVDLDPAMTRLFSTRPMLRQLNDDSLHSPKLTIHNQDAQKFLEDRDAQRPYDRIIIDFPDPNNVTLGRLYTESFYRLVVQNLAGSGYAITQATSPYLARTSFWSIVHTIEAVDSPVVLGAKLDVRPMHTYVPTFGQWGFVVFSPRTIDVSRWRLEVPTKFLNRPNFAGHFVFPKDVGEVPAQANRLDDLVLVRYYQNDWQQYFQP